MASDESFLALVHYRGSIKKKTRSEIKFTDKDPLSIFLKPLTSFTEFKNAILHKLGVVPFRHQFSEVRTPELLAKLVDVVSSSGGSNRNPHSSGHPTYSSSMPVGSLLVVPVLAPEADLVTSPSFAFNLNHNGDTEVGEAGPLGEVAIAMPDYPMMVLVFREVGVPDGVDNALHDNDDGDDVELATIADDNDDEIARTTPTVGGGASSSGTNQYPLHFSTLDLDAMAPQGDPSVPIDFEARDTHNTGVVSEFQTGQQFQDKEEVVLNVKTYSIHCGIEYKVLESDNRKYYSKCKEFGSGCAWLTQVSLRQCKGIWEVNGTMVLALV
ncbi:uncharacterized protein LOC130934609 [Arachis stenosperma]|uniref:uncharacterized protein LOC130934609 n=1 Tax=Arachis stenosperma TaxID=217475 RepID=UPI0025AC0A29|nr:uncharacterized protein LOC130934609 [Arachis stenosperma]